MDLLFALEEALDLVVFLTVVLHHQVLAVVDDLGIEKTVLVVDAGPLDTLDQEIEDLDAQLAQGRVDILNERAKDLTDVLDEVDVLKAGKGVCLLSVKELLQFDVVALTKQLQKPDDLFEDDSSPLVVVKGL